MSTVYPSNSDEDSHDSDSTQEIQSEDPRNNTESPPKMVRTDPKHSSAKRKDRRSESSENSSVLSDNVARKMARLERENAVLSEYVTGVKASTDQKIFAKGRQNNAMKALISEVFRTIIWRKYKFISNIEQEQAITGKIFDLIDMPDIQKTSAAKTVFIRDYSLCVITEFNKLRTYKMQRLARPVFALLGAAPDGDDEQGDAEQDNTPSSITEMPTLAQMVSCMSRKFSPNDDQMMAIFMWYWDKFLPHVTGSGLLFKSLQRHYTTISKCAPKHQPNQPYMTPSLEAFAVLAFENNEEKWKYQAELKKKYPQKRIIPAKRKVDKSLPEPDEDSFEISGETIRLYGPKSRGKYTMPDSGQARYGGWKKEGLDRYIELYKMAKAGRKARNCKEIEQESLEDLRNKNGLVAKTHEEELLLQNGHTKRIHARTHFVDTWVDIESSDEEDEESDDDGKITAV